MPNATARLVSSDAARYSEIGEPALVKLGSSLTHATPRRRPPVSMTTAACTSLLVTAACSPCSEARSPSASSRVND